jgi:hypothetical protein
MLHRTLMSLVVGLALATGGSLVAAEPKIPATAEQHFALAKQYAEKGETYRKEAADHRKMLADFRLKPANVHAKWQGDRNPALKKMEKHCVAIATAAEKVAIENEKAADYHTLRGKELQGR